MSDEIVLLIETREADSEAVAAVAESDAASGLDLQVVSPSEATGRIRELLESGVGPAAIVLGPHLPDPIAVARECYQSLPLVQLVLLALPSNEAELRRRLAVAPRIGTNWTLASAAPDGLARTLEAAVRATRQRRQHRTTLDRVRLSLSAPPPPTDASDYRRLVLSDRYLGSILTHAQEAIFSTDPRGVIRTWNPGAKKLLGYAEHEVLGRTIEILDAGNATDVLGQIVRAASNDALDARRELLLRKANGEGVPVETSVGPVRDDQGAVIGVSVIARDVTDRKRAEAALREQEEWLRVTLESIGDGVIATDVETRVEFLNPVAERLTGWQRGDAAGRPVEEVFRIVNEETRNKVENPIDRTIREGVIVGLANHTVLLARDGVERPIDDSAAPIRDPNGRVRGGVLVFRDVSDRKRDEALRDVRFAVTRVFAERTSEEVAIPEILQLVCRRLNWQVGAYWEVDAVTRLLRARHVLQDPTLTDERFVLATRELELEPGQGLPGRVVSTGKAVWLSEVPADRRLPRVQTAADSGLNTAFAFPVHADSKVIGAIEFFSREEKARDESLIEVFAGIGGQLGLFLHRLSAEKRLREETEVVEALHRTGSLLAAELDLERILQTVVREATRLIGAAYGAFVCEASAHRPGEWLYAASGAGSEGLSLLEPPPGGPSVRSVFGGKAAIRVEDAEIDAEFAQRLSAIGVLPAGGYARSFLAVPVASRAEEPVGALLFGHPQVRRFTSRHERLVSGLAAQAAVAIANARLFDEVRQERAKVERSERYYRTLTEVVPQLIWTASSDGKIQWFNDRWREAIGFAAEDSLGDGWIAALHPDDKESTFAAWRASVDAGNPFRGEHRLRTPQGDYRWYLTLALPLLENDRVVQWFGTCTDIHDQKRAERQARFLAESGTALSTLVDFQSTLQKVARLAVPFFADFCLVDLVSEDGSIAPVAHAHADPSKEDLLQRFQGTYPLNWARPSLAGSVVESGKGTLFDEVNDELVQRMTWDEQQRALLRELSPISALVVPLQVRGRTFGVMQFFTAESGDRYRIDDLEFAQEIARRAAAAIDNSSLYREVRDADRRKDEFLAMLAHELRNPLAPIRSGLDLLRLSNVEADVVEAMGQQVEHMVRLVDDLLDVSRIIRGKIELRKERVELQAVLKRAVETSRPLIQSQDHELSVRAPSEEIWLEADPVRLAQVIANLLNNAAKYTERGGRIWLSADAMEDGVAICVRDDGVGMDADLLPKVFDLFSQSDRTVERSQGGLGIGLTLVKSLVELHGGTVAAASAGLGKGSEFVVRLPAPDRTRLAPMPEWKPQPTRRLRVLLVEDMVASGRMLAKLLTRFWNHEVHLVHDGIAALEAAKVFRPELVLLDVGLPGMTGYEVAERLQHSPDRKDFLLVALTGYGQPEDRRRTNEAGFDEHLVKPASVQMLEALFKHPKLRDGRTT